MDAVVDDEREARDGRDEEHQTLHPSRQRQHQAAQEHALIRRDEHDTIHRRVRRGLAPALVARPRRGERV